VLQEVIALLKPGLSIADACAFGDDAIEKAVAKVYKSKKAKEGEETKKEVEKGVAFPTCVSVNHTLAYCSPLRSESGALAEGDCVKVALGVHIDGAVALVAHTVVLSGGAVEGPLADVIVAAYEAAEVALRAVKPGATNGEVTAAIEGVAKAFGVAPFTAVQGAQLTRFALDGGKVIPQKRETDGTKYPACKFEAGEAYSIDIAFSTGEGKMHESEQRTTVFKRNVEVRRARVAAPAPRRPLPAHPPTHPP
jgi:curved DNA binding protein